MAKTFYPIALDIENRRCLVVGGGTIATDKVEGLLAAGAQVIVVSPAVSPRITELAREGEITLHRRPYRSDDLDGVYLVYGATDDLELNAAIIAQARQTGILANAVDDPPNCDFYAVAVVRRGDLQVSISTNGHSPAFARWLREYLDDWLPHEYSDLLAVLSEVRKQVKAEGPIPPYEHWHEAISDEVLVRLRHGDRAGARNHIYEVVSEAQAQLAPLAAGAVARWGN